MKKDYTKEIETAYEELFVKLLGALLMNDQKAIARLQVEATELYKLRENSKAKYNLDISVRIK